jgi:hypothetical protein
MGDDFVTCNLKEDEVKRLLRDELEVYSYQFKQASTVFNKGQVIHVHWICDLAYSCSHSGFEM